MMPLRRDLTGTDRASSDRGKALFDYQRAGFDLGRAWKPIARRLWEIKEGRGFALPRGLPRDGLFPMSSSRSPGRWETPAASRS